MYADTIHANSDKFSLLLQLFDYSNGYIFSNVWADVGRIIVDIMQKANIEADDYTKTILYRLSKEEAMNFDVQ